MISLSPSLFINYRVISNFCQYTPLWLVSITLLWPSARTAGNSILDYNSILDFKLLPPPSIHLVTLEGSSLSWFIDFLCIIPSNQGLRRSSSAIVATDRCRWPHERLNPGCLASYRYAPSSPAAPRTRKSPWLPSHIFASWRISRMCWRGGWQRKLHPCGCQAASKDAVAGHERGGDLTHRLGDIIYVNTNEMIVA
jgi:hypothetical protein